MPDPSRNKFVKALGQLSLWLAVASVALGIWYHLKGRTEAALYALTISVVFYLMRDRRSDYE